jgi:hypothetical protein
MDDLERGVTKLTISRQQFAPYRFIAFWQIPSDIITIT